MDADLIAALERAAELIVNGGARCQQDAAIIRVEIDRLRNGGERAQIVAWLRDSAAWHDKHCDGLSGFDKIAEGQREAADAIEAGAHRQEKVVE